MTKNADILLYSNVSWKLSTNFQGKLESLLCTGAPGTWQPMIFTYFAPSSTGGCFFPSQDAKHKNTLSQLHAMGSLFDGKYNQHVSTNYRGVFRT